MSNIEPIARQMAERICRQHNMPEPRIADWVEQHWEVAAAMLEIDAMSEDGTWRRDADLRDCLNAYRNRVART